MSQTFAQAHGTLSKLGWEDIQKIHQQAQFHIWLQFHLFRQLDQVIKYAHDKGIAIKGELQMRVLKNSVDTWKFPHLFTSEEKDGYAVFNWKAMEEENFMWWKKRMRVMSWYLDIYSIKDDAVCSEESLPIYKKMIPQLVAATNMMAWRNGWENLRLLPSFTAQEKTEAPYLSTIYTSTPQSMTMRMWLGEELKTIIFNSEDKKKVYYDATSQECTSQIRTTLERDSMFAIIPIQDWLSIDSKLRSRFPYSERINDPQEKEQVWKYRMHINLESLLEADSLNNIISNLISETSRAD